MRKKYIDVKTCSYVKPKKSKFKTALENIASTIIGGIVMFFASIIFGIMFIIVNIVDLIDAFLRKIEKR